MFLRLTNKLTQSAITLCCILGLADVHAARCLFVSSYHQGYPWADGIEKGVKKVLTNRCQFKQINMNTKRFKDEIYKTEKANEIRAFIDQWKPDVIIAADDNASKYLIAPYFKESKIPVVFCGVNWTVKEYGFPTSNITGMIEVSPIQEIFEKIVLIVPGAKQGTYIGVDTLTEQKSYERFHEVAKRFNMSLLKSLAKTQAEWNQYYINAQQTDFLILGTESGINDWNNQAAQKIVLDYGRKFSITDYEWMTHFAAMGLVKVASEQGEWAAKVALSILNGTPPSAIPIIPNQTWDMIVNEQLLKNIDVIIPEHIRLTSKKIDAR